MDTSAVPKVPHEGFSRVKIKTCVQSHIIQLGHAVMLV